MGHPRIAYRCTLHHAQGRTVLAGLLLSYIEGEAEAFGALVLLMRERGLRALYLPDMALLQVLLCLGAGGACCTGKGQRGTRGLPPGRAC